MSLSISFFRILGTQTDLEWDPKTSPYRNQVQVSGQDMEQALDKYKGCREFQALTYREKEILGFLDITSPTLDEEQSVDVSLVLFNLSDWAGGGYGIRIGIIKATVFQPRYQPTLYLARREGS